MLGSSATGGGATASQFDDHPKALNGVENAPKPFGPYSQAMVANGFVFVSGQLGINPKTMDFAGNNVSSQTSTCLQNIDAILREANSGWDSVVKVTAFLKSMDTYGEFNETYSSFFKKGDAFPARSVYAVKGLPKDALVEIEVVAMVPNRSLPRE